MQMGKKPHGFYYRRKYGKIQADDSAFIKKYYIDFWESVLKCEKYKYTVLFFEK